jgi:hypothetical protein
MRTSGFFAGIICPLTIFLSTEIQAQTSFYCAGHQSGLADAAAKALLQRPLPTRGHLNVLVIFARFNDAPPKPVPAFAADDDGVVDYLFINLQSTPRHFISGWATGIAGLGFETDYAAADLSSRYRGVGALDPGRQIW